MPISLKLHEPDPPLYIRWTPDTCPFALEMRLDLMTRLKGELDQSEQLGLEIGGVFVGVFPTQDAPTLRLDDLLFVPRSDAPANAKGTEYSLDPYQLARLTEITAEARFTERPVVGFFRSHLRAAPLAPSPPDVAMLTQQFPGGLYALLLIGAQQPRLASFYLAIGGALPDSPSTPAFPFEESAFRSLPEVPAEATEDVRNFAFGRKASHPIPWAALAILGLLIVLISLWTFGGRISQFFRPQSNQIDLNVSSTTGPNLKITWDHGAPTVSRALGATIVIRDGPSHRELKLDSDDLRLGQVAYERLTRKVNVVMQLDTPGLRLPPQTFDWTGN